MYCTLAEILYAEENLQFASMMVQVLNMILFTTTELYELRVQLKDLKTPVSVCVCRGVAGERWPCNICRLIHGEEYRYKAWSISSDLLQPSHACRKAGISSQLFTAVGATTRLQPSPSASSHRTTTTPPTWYKSLLTLRSQLTSSRKLTPLFS